MVANIMTDTIPDFSLLWLLIFLAALLVVIVATVAAIRIYRWLPPRARRLFVAAVAGVLAGAAMLTWKSLQRPTYFECENLAAGYSRVLTTDMATGCLPGERRIDR